MGCDIHIRLERNIQGKWEEINIEPDLLPDDRHYELFHFLFGVRPHDSSAIFYGRGLPSDVSFADWKREHDKCFHSITHVYANEFEKVKWPENLEGCYFFIFCDYCLPRLANWIGLENVRMIIAFDN